jgi:hypothetical protein
MDFSFWMILGFLFAAYSVIANDSVQTLGTWIASNNNRFKWYVLWGAAAAVLLFTIWYGWYVNAGDISYGRLNKIPFVDIQWYHAVAPAVLLLLTRIGIPVSTSFLVLSSFASAIVMGDMLLKSVAGYAVAAVSAYVIWFVVSGFFDESKPIKEANKKYWRVGQWVTTGFLWSTWLMHDIANIAVFLPRVLSIEMMIFVSIVFVFGLGYMFYNRGGKIQKIVIEKHNTKYVRSATIIDFVYWLILFFFKELNDVPMSTTWVFVGLLAGRELAIRRDNLEIVFPMLARDFLKMLFGLAVSVIIVILIHFVFI